MARAHHRKWRRPRRAAELLSAKPYTSRELLEALRQDPEEDDRDLKVRTVQRLLKDLGAVQDLGCHPPVYHLLDEHLRPVEALITHSMLRMLYHHTPGYNAVYFEILRKLARQLPEPAQSVALRSTAALRERQGHLTDEGTKLTLIAEAWFERRLIEFDYLKPSGSGRARRNESRSTLSRFPGPTWASTSSAASGAFTGPCAPTSSTGCAASGPWATRGPTPSPRTAASTRATTSRPPGVSSAPRAGRRRKSACASPRSRLPHPRGKLPQFAH